MGLTGALDTLLDRTIVPGYSRIGYAVRRAWWAADVAPDALRGQTVVVTGANSGLGAATSLGLVRLGASVRMLCRDTGRGAAARDEILAAAPGADLVVEECDLSDQKSVRAVAARLRGELRALLAAGTDARVVFVSSGGMYTQPLRIDDPEYRAGDYNGTKAYARTKRMQVVLAQLWAQRLAALGVSVHAMHPGWAATPGITDSLPGFARVVGPILRTPAEGADTAVWLVGSGPAGRATGLFWQDRRPRPTSYLPFTITSDTDAERLWDFCVAATDPAYRASE